MFLIKPSIWFCNQVLTLPCKNIKFFVKQLFGFHVYWINIDIYTATICFTGVFSFSFSRNIEPVLKSRIGVIGWGDFFLDDIIVSETEIGTGEDTMSLAGVFKDFPSWKVGDRSLSIRFA